MPVGDIVVGYHVTLAIYLDRVFRGDGGRIAREFRPYLRAVIPGQQFVGIVPADEDVVRDVEILGAGPFVLHHPSDILGARMDQGEAAGTGNVFPAQQEGDRRVAHRDAVEVIVVRGHQVEEIEIAVAVEDHLAVARRFDHDRLVGRTAGGEEIGPVERRAIGGRVGVEAGIVSARVFIETGMHQDGIARLHTGWIGNGVI